jgi:hypothetical protein
MLDVHPPHEAAHTWKDFFIHIATIVIGLLIAVGLEQTVEFFHHRHQVQELREALKQEREENRRSFTLNVACYRLDRAVLINDLHVLLYLQQHPGTPEEKLPGTPEWRQSYQPFIDAAYSNAEQSQTLIMLPQKESESLSYFYKMLAKADEAALDSAVEGTKAAEFSPIDPNPSHLNPAQLDKNIGLLTDALFDNFRWGLYLWHIGEDNKGFSGGPTYEEFQQAGGYIRNPEDKKKLTAAEAQTDEALKPTMTAMKAASAAYAASAH